MDPQAHDIPEDDARPLPALSALIGLVRLLARQAARDAGRQGPPLGAEIADDQTKTSQDD
jgi:hypothetical protein